MKKVIALRVTAVFLLCKVNCLAGIELNPAKDCPPKKAAQIAGPSEVLHPWFSGATCTDAWMQIIPKSSGVPRLEPLAHTKHESPNCFATEMDGGDATFTYSQTTGSEWSVSGGGEAKYGTKWGEIKAHIERSYGENKKTTITTQQKTPFGPVPSCTERTIKFWAYLNKIPIDLERVVTRFLPK